MAGPLAVRGVKELIRANRLMEPAIRRETTKAFRRVGSAVQGDATARFERYSPKTAGGYRTYVRQRGIGVEQSLRRTTGLRPDFGALQMRKALVPALEDNREETMQLTERAIDEVCDLWERA